MKKMLVAVAVALAFTACQNSQKNVAGNDEVAATETAEAVAGTHASLPVAYIQIDSLMLHYQLAEDLRNAFQAKASKADRELTAKYQKLESDMLDAQDKVQKGLVTRATAEEMQQKLIKQEQDLMATRERMMGELAEEEQVMNNRIYYAVMDYLKEFNADYKYSMIISTSAAGPILHADPQMDITQDVLAALNARYAEEKSGSGK